MMRPWKIWSAFIACLAIVIAAVGWMSFKALEADDAEEAARQQAALEENGRLALWRMDSAVAPLIAQESSRPFFTYAPFYAGDGSQAGASKGRTDRETTMPSPLLVEPPRLVRLHFQIDPKGNFSSPRVLTSAQRDRAIPKYLSSHEARDAKQLLAHVHSLVKPLQLLAWLERRWIILAAAPIANERLVPQQSTAAEVQQQRGDNEYQARSQFLAQNSQNPANWQPPAASIGAAADAQTGIMKPLWVGNELLLVRLVHIEGQDFIQGCLLDWPAIQLQLLESVGDLLPNARLLTAYNQYSPDEGELLVSHPSPPAERNGLDDTSEHLAHELASLPVRLELGTLADPPAASMSPVRLSLIVAWGAMAMAALAVAVLLRGVLSLSERRATFVSAVTHELRTPLTTFRMYSEMLADDMVPDEASQRSYLQTLRVEADRLTHLVENVLSYARLERGRPGGRIKPVMISQILDLATDRLSDRARQAGFELIVEADDAARNCRVLADPSAVEQILFNLVDNACKYAATATDRALHLEPETKKSDGQIWLRLRDHGPGIAAGQRRVLFQPFRKSADEAAHSAPGVGLGLALCRRLARDMGGDLVYEPAAGEGACFAVRLRAASGVS